MIDQASRVLTLEFSMQRLQENQLREAKLFQRQTDMLQAIEKQIAQEETDALVQQIMLREKAAIFRVTEREKEIKRVAELKRDQKR